MGLQHYNQDMSKIPIKYNINVLFTQSIHTLRLSVGGRTDGRTDARTHGRTENIYSIFWDKLLLLGEHILLIDFVNQMVCFAVVTRHFRFNLQTVLLSG